LRTCTLDALPDSPLHHVPACKSVLRAVTKKSDAEYGATMFELCETLASGMNSRGVARFTACLKGNIGAGVRICLWDPSATPCTEGNGQSDSLEPIDFFE
jgi:hypothetical protein